MSKAAEIRAREVLKRLRVSKPVGAEIGVYCGQMSAHLLAHKYLTLYMVDSWRDAAEQPAHYTRSGDFHAALPASTQERYMRRALEATLFAVTRRHVLRMDSLDAANQVEDGSLDFVFIDADHSYEGCRADIEAWLPKVKHGGLLGGHDYANKAYPGFGVSRAVDEAVKRHGWTLDLGANFTWFVRV